MSVGTDNTGWWVMYLVWKINDFCLVKNEEIKLFDETRIWILIIRK